MLQKNIGNSNQNGKQKKTSDFCAVKSGMLAEDISSPLALYILAGINGFTEYSGYGRGEFDWFIEYFHLDGFSRDEIENAIESLQKCGLIRVSEGGKSEDSYEFISTKAQSKYTGNRTGNYYS